MRAYSSWRKNFLYGTPGLGDRVHSVFLAHNYGKINGDEVNLHLTKYQYNKHKPESWAEILELFPKGCVNIIPHLEHEPTSNQDFANYVRSQGYYNAKEQIYKDHPQRFEPTEGVDLTSCLQYFPQLPAEDCGKDLQLPEKFITVQFDSTSRKRSIKPHIRNRILSKYSDYQVVTVGGESQNDYLKNSLKHIAYAMTKAKHHVGVDSGFLHLSQLYFHPENIHIYTSSHSGKWSHHMFRARDNGIRIYNEN